MKSFSISIKLDKIKTPNGYKRGLAWQRPTLTGGEPPTTIGAKELNFRVRYGNGCDLFAIATRLFRRFVPSKLDNRQSSLETCGPQDVGHAGVVTECDTFSLRSLISIWLSPRPISICQLHVSPRFHPKPINLIIFQGSY